MHYVVLQNQTTNGSGGVVGGIDFIGRGPAKLWVDGVFDGSTTTVEQSYDGNSWFPLLLSNGSAAAFTEKAAHDFFSLKGCYLKATVSDAGALTNMSVYIT